MDMSDVTRRGLVLLGCGKMGSAMLQGWLGEGLGAASVWVTDPFPSKWLLSQSGIHLNNGFPDDPAIVLIAVKPQMMSEALPALTALGDTNTLFVSVAAGTAISAYEDVLGKSSSIIRAMPNTPAAVGKGITALIGNDHVSDEQMRLAEALMSAVGETVRLDSEAQMDAVTGVSGSGPAYVFHLIETLAAAGEIQGLPAELAMQLAKATVAGAGALAKQSDEPPSQLRVNVTSPGGTTAAALEVLMDNETGFPKLLHRAVKAAADRSQELGK